jgi:ribonuclease VapC
MKAGMTNKVVLDASAVLALLHREPGEAVVAEFIQTVEAAISIVNVAEVLSKQQDVGIPASEALPLLELLGIQICDFDQNAAIQTAELRKMTKAYGLSLGDRACLALGKELDCSVLTADQIWSQLSLDIEIILIR